MTTRDERRDRQSRRIPKARPLADDRPLAFSFKHLDLHNPKFHYSFCDGDFMHHLLLRMQQLSGMAVSGFKEWDHYAHRHVIVWQETTEPKGFAHLDPQLQLLDGWQFQVWPQKIGRVHGILIEEVFHIVWLDPLHHLYAIANP